MPGRSRSSNPFCVRMGGEEIRDRSEKNTFLIMLCGIPGSGKSTVARELIRQLGDVEVIATDAIGGRGRRYGKLHRRLEELTGVRRYVVLDGTFYSRERRNEVRAQDCPVLLVYLNCPLELCLARNRDRRDGIPERGVHAMARRFEPPSEDERALEIRTDQTDPEATARRIYRAVLRRHRGAGGDGTAPGEEIGV